MLHLLKSGGAGGGLRPFFLNFLDLPLERVAMLGRLVKVEREDDDGGKGGECDEGGKGGEGGEGGKGSEGV